MLVIEAQDVGQALKFGVWHLLQHGVREETRNGPCLVSSGPVMTVTSDPRKRVLLSPVRDANPFFHIYETIWMLAGRDEVASLVPFVKRYEGYADQGVVHGAYGHRWRQKFQFDQLDAIVRKLRASPGDRQCVLQMWDCRPGQFHVKGFKNPEAVNVVVGGSDDLMGTWHDRPCNTHAYARIRDLPMTQAELDTAGPERVLDLTVCCRSNDAVWGAHGANAVHFSILQEYLAARVGCGVGVMYQLSNNYHAYESELENIAKRCTPDKWLKPEMLEDDRYASGAVVSSPMFTEPDSIDEDVRMFMEWYDESEILRGPRYEIRNLWFCTVATPMMIAHMLYRNKSMDAAIETAKHIEAQDWRAACVEWLERRRVK